MRNGRCGSRHFFAAIWMVRFRVKQAVATSPKTRILSCGNDQFQNSR